MMFAIEIFKEYMQQVKFEEHTTVMNNCNRKAEYANQHTAKIYLMYIFIENNGISSVCWRIGFLCILTVALIGYIRLG